MEIYADYNREYSSRGEGLRMRILAIDWGEKKIGLAIGEKLANELSTIDSKNAVSEISKIVQSDGVENIIIGYPLRSQGEGGTHNRKIDDFINELQSLSPLAPVEKIDEAFSSVEALRELQNLGLKGKEAEKRVDQCAAKIILDDYLNSLG